MSFAILTFTSVEVTPSGIKLSLEMQSNMGIFYLQLIFAGYTGSKIQFKIPKLKLQFVEIDSSK